MRKKVLETFSDIIQKTVPPKIIAKDRKLEFADINIIKLITYETSASLVRVFMESVTRTKRVFFLAVVLWVKFPVIL